MGRETDIVLNRSAVGSRPAGLGSCEGAFLGDALVECIFLNVRFHPDSDRTADIAACLKCATSGSRRALLDHFVCARQDGLGYVYSYCLSR